MRQLSGSTSFSFLTSFLLPFLKNINRGVLLNRGEETVTVKINVVTKTISLNANELEILSSSIRVNGLKYEAESIVHEKAKETTVITFPNDLPMTAEAHLHVVFTGILNNQMAGFYRGEYTNSKGEKKNMAATQFEATDARKAFPCWDEPALKATFKVFFLLFLGGKKRVLK